MPLRLTVAIATCGRADALSRCLRAVGAQTRPPDEIIVVDQDPSDEVRAVIRNCGLQVRHLEQERLGVSASRNLALANARGDVLAITDDDCFADESWTAVIVQVLESDPSLAAVTGPVLPPSGERPRNMAATSSRPSRDTVVYSAGADPWTVGSGGNFAARVSELKAIGGWDERLGPGTLGMAAEDIDMFDRLLTAGARICYDGRALVYHAWQTTERRKATRWAYGFGIGAICGLRFAARDAYGWRILGTYLGMKLRETRAEVRNRSWNGVRERLTTFTAVVPGCVYGMRAGSSGRRHIDFEGADN